jgi:hypothetical protein
MRTIIVLQHFSRNFFKPVDPIYPFLSGFPPFSDRKMMELYSIVTELMARTSDLGNLDRNEIVRLIQKCAYINIEIKIESDAAFGLESPNLGSETFWREITPDMFWFWANQDGLLKKMLPKCISHKNLQSSQ